MDGWKTLSHSLPSQVIIRRLENLVSITIGGNVSATANGTKNLGNLPNGINPTYVITVPVSQYNNCFLLVGNGKVELKNNTSNSTVWVEGEVIYKV